MIEKLNSLQVAILTRLKQGPESSRKLYLASLNTVGYLKFSGEELNQAQVLLEEFVADVLAHYAELGLIQFLGAGMWEATEEGFRLLRLSVMDDPKRALYKMDDTHYLGEELKATCLRPGAYDFLAHPSRIGDALVLHKNFQLSQGV